MPASLSNIKLLNKRYTTKQWKEGVLVDGNTTIVPKLWPGEFGFNSDTQEVRANLSTATANEENAILFSEATVVSFPGLTQSTTASRTGKYIQAVVFDKDESGSQLTVTEATLPGIVIELDPQDPLKGAGAFITSISVDNTNDHKLLFKTGNHPVSTLTVSKGNNTGADALEDTCVPVMTAIDATGSDGHSHQITYTTAELPTKKYVDSRVAEKSIKVSQSGSGNYVSSVVPTTDGRELIVTNSTLPTYASTGSAGSKDATSTTQGTILGQVVISDSVNGGKTTHTISGTNKIIKGSITDSGNGSITVSEANNQIVIKLDDSKYALAEDCSMAMVFKGTLSSEAADGATNSTLSGATKAQVGDTYKVLRAGTYGGLDALPGDMIICRQKGTGSTATYEWILIPSGDDVDKFVTSVEAGAGLVKSGTALAPVISHIDYGSTTLTNLDGYATSINTGNHKGYGVKGKFVTDIAFDNDGLGHVQKAALSDELNLATIEGAIQIAQDYESETTIQTQTGTPLTITDGGADGDHVYTISHNAQTRTNNTGTAQTPGYGGKFSVITGIESTSEGHVSKVTTTEITLPASDNSFRAVDYTGKDNPQDTATKTKASLLSSSSGTALNVVSGKNIKVSGNSSNGTLTIDTLGTATNTTLGFVKLGTSTTLTGTTSTLTPVQDKTYPVGMDSNNKLHVYVPWENTDVYGHQSITPDTEFRFAVFKRDRGGHISAIDDIQILDANY